MSSGIPHYRSFRVAFNAFFGPTVSPTERDRIWGEAVSHLAGKENPFEDTAYAGNDLTKKLSEMVLDSDDPKTDAVFVRAALRVLQFEAAGRKVIRPSFGLAKLLDATLPTLPVGSVRPPYRSVYICLNRLGYKVQPLGASKLHEIEGVYVENYALSEHQKAQIGAEGNVWRFYVSLVYMPDEKGLFSISSVGLDYDLEDKRSISELLLDRSKGSVDAVASQHKIPRRQVLDRMAAFDAVISLIFNIFSYMSSPEGKADTRIEKPKIFEKHAKAKNWFDKAKLAQEIRVTCPAETTYVGESITIPAGSELVEIVSEEDSARTVCTHWRRGHWRRVWIGMMESPDRRLEPRWIRPVLVNKGVSRPPERAYYHVVEPKG